MLKALTQARGASKGRSWVRLPWPGYVLHLRVGLLFENSFSFIPVIRHAGVAGGFPIRGELSIPMVATRNIATVAARRLQALDFQGQGHTYVLGRREPSFREMAAIIGRALGRPELNWADVSAAEATGGLRQADFSLSAAALVGLSDSIDISSSRRPGSAALGD